MRNLPYLNDNLARSRSLEESVMGRPTPTGGLMIRTDIRQFRMTGADLPRPRMRVLSGARYVPNPGASSRRPEVVARWDPDQKSDWC